MPSGFIGRYLGKIGIKQLWLAGITGPLSQVTASGADLSVLAGASSVATPSTSSLSPSNAGVLRLSSVGGTTWNLAAPVAGVYKTIVSTNIGDGTRKISSTVAGAVFASSLAVSWNNINFSTLRTESVELVGLSTSVWGIIGVWAPQSTALGVSTMFSTGA